MEGDRSVVCLQVVAGPRNNRKCIVRGPAPWSAARLAARPDGSIVAPAAGGSGDRVETRSLCQICDRLGLIPDHSRIFRRMRPLGAGLATASTDAYLRRPRPRSENPGVGGSIPSQPTIVFSPAGNDLARAARTRRAPRPVDSDGTRTDALRSGGLCQGNDGRRGRLGLVERLELCRALLQRRLVYDRVAP